MRRALFAGALALGCAHSGPPQKVQFDEPSVIVAGVDLPALWDAMVDDQAAGRWADSMEKVLRYIRHHDTPGAQMRAALAEYHLGRLDAAARRLQAVSERSDVPPLLRGEALLQEGVCRVELRDPARAEPLLRRALDIFEDRAREERIDPSLFAQADYWLGEGYRTSFQAQTLDPASMGDDQLSQALEAKAKLLLSAQDQYLRCIRRGDGDWATAAGFHIGEMYEELHDQLLAARLPSRLTEEQQAVYREHLRDRVRTLVQKAMRIYEETLSLAERTRTRGEYVGKIHAALERMRRLLLGQN